MITSADLSHAIIRNDDTLEAYERLFLIVVLDRCNPKRDNGVFTARYSTSELVERSALSRSTVNRLLKDLRVEEETESTFERPLIIQTPKTATGYKAKIITFNPIWVAKVTNLSSLEIPSVTKTQDSISESSDSVSESKDSVSEISTSTTEKQSSVSASHPYKKNNKKNTKKNNKKNIKELEPSFLFSLKRFANGVAAMQYANNSGAYFSMAAGLVYQTQEAMKDEDASKAIAYVSASLTGAYIDSVIEAQTINNDVLSALVAA